MNVSSIFANGCIIEIGVPPILLKIVFPLVSIPLNNAGIYLRKSFYHTTELSSCVNITPSGQPSILAKGTIKYASSILSTLFGPWLFFVKDGPSK